MNQRQKNAILIFRITGIIFMFLGIAFMASGSYRYPTQNISNVGAGLFVFLLLIIFSLPGIIMLLLSNFLGKMVGTDLGD